MRSTTVMIAKPPDTPVTTGVTTVLSRTGSPQSVDVAFLAAIIFFFWRSGPGGCDTLVMLTEALFGGTAGQGTALDLVHQGDVRAYAGKSS